MQLPGGVTQIKFSTSILASQVTPKSWPVKKKNNKMGKKY